MTITLATLSQASAQQVFDQIAVHLLTQREKSMGPRKLCVYRAPTSDKPLSCAAGCLMSDAEYQLRFEENNWDALIDANRVPDAHGGLIFDLQQVHDDYETLMWKAALLSLASRRYLNTYAIDDLAAIT